MTRVRYTRIVQELRRIDCNDIEGINRFNYLYVCLQIRLSASIRLFSLVNVVERTFKEFRRYKTT